MNDDLTKIDLIRKELHAIVEHQDSLDVMDKQIGLDLAISEALEALEFYLDYKTPEND